MKKKIFEIKYYSNMGQFYRRAFNQRTITFNAGAIPENSPYRVLGKFFAIRLFSSKDYRILSYFFAVLHYFGKCELEGAQASLESFQKFRQKYLIKKLLELKNGDSFYIKIFENFPNERVFDSKDPLLLRKFKKIIPKIFRLWDESLSEVDSK